MFGSKRIVVILIVVGAATASLAACGGGGKKNTTPTGEPAATSTDGKTPSTSSSATTGGTTSPELAAVAKKFAAATFKATYHLSTTNTDSATIEPGTMVLYKQGDKRLRFDVTAKRDGKDSQIIFIQNGETSIFCLKDAAEFGAIFGVSEGQGLCFNSKSTADNPADSIGTTFSDIENADVTVIEKSARTVAGQKTDCYRTKDNETGGITTACFSGDGAILYSKDEGDSPSEIEATDVSGSVSDSDFDAPYEVKDLADTGDGSLDPLAP